MPEPVHATPYPDVNVVLHGFVSELRSILGDHFRGMYLTGSLALGDFDPRTSDIDFIVLTDITLSADHVDTLREMQGRFERSDAPWAGRVEAVYVTPEALRVKPLSGAHYPQVEKGVPVFLAPLESGWIFHLYTLREHGVTVVGPDVRPLIERVDPDDMRRAAAPVAELWLEQAHTDPSWLPWLSRQENQAFVVLTLCRLLYTLDSGSVASKLAAARWAQRALESRWATLIAEALRRQHDCGEASDSDIAETLAMVQFAVDRFQRWRSTMQSAQ
jgi:hypothetical protein